MKKFLERLLIILFPLGLLYAVGKALFYKGDLITFLGCIIIGLAGFVGGSIFVYNNPSVIETIVSFWQRLF